MPVSVHRKRSKTAVHKRKSEMAGSVHRNEIMMPGSVHRNRSMVAVHKGSVHRNRAWSEAGTQPPALQLASYQQLCCMTMSQACNCTEKPRRYWIAISDDDDNLENHGSPFQRAILLSANAPRNKPISCIQSWLTFFLSFIFLFYGSRIL
eukprot:53996-Pelagomonas_calceolata.AAC.3